MSPLLVDRFGRSLRFCHQEFDQEAISDDFMEHSRVLWACVVLKDLVSLLYNKSFTAVDLTLAVVWPLNWITQLTHCDKT